MGVCKMDNILIQRIFTAEALKLIHTSLPGVSLSAFIDFLVIATQKFSPALTLISMPLLRGNTLVMLPLN